MRPPRVFAADLGAERVLCGVFRRGTAGRLVLQHFAGEPVRARDVHGMAWTEEVARALGGFAAREKMRGPLWVSLPSELVYMKRVVTPAVRRGRQERALAFEAAQSIPCPLDEVVWDSVVLADDGLDLEALLVAAKLAPVRALCAAIEKAGLHIVRALAPGFALRSAFRHGAGDAGGSAIVADVGASRATFAFLDGQRFALRSVGTTTGDVPGAVKLAAEIARSIRHCCEPAGIAAPRALYLGGEAVPGPEMLGAIEARVGLRTVAFDPLRNIDVAAAARLAGADAAPSRLTILAGIAAAFAGDDQPAPQLLPAPVVSAAAARRRRPWLVAAAALLALAPVAPIARHRQLAEMQARRGAELEAELRPRRELAAQSAQKRAELERLARAIAALQPAFAARTGWLEFLGDLQSRLVNVEDVWLDRMRMEADTASTRITLGGRMLDGIGANAGAPAAARERVQRLRDALRGSPFVAGVAEESFAGSAVGLLQFEFTLTLNAEAAL